MKPLFKSNKQAKQHLLNNGVKIGNELHLAEGVSTQINNNQVKLVKTCFMSNFDENKQIQSKNLTYSPNVELENMSVN